MIPREDIITGILATPLVALLQEIDEVKPSPRVRPLFDLISETGVLQKKGDKYKRGQAPPVGEVSPIAEAVAELFQHIVFPYPAAGRQAVRLSRELQRALYVYTSAYQAFRITAVQELLKFGGLTLVAGWFPCAFSSELMSIAGRDVVIVEEREDILTLEMDRLSLIPLAPSPPGRELAAAGFYAFEITRLDDLEQVAEKYGKFDTAIVCNRGVDVTRLGGLADEIFYIMPKDKVIFQLNDALLRGLGLTAPAQDADKALRKAEREELGPFEIYILRSAGTA